MRPAGGRAIRQLSAIVLLAMLSLLAAALPAAAEPIVIEPPKDEARAVCATAEVTADYQYLPVERWSGATQKLHVRSGGGFPIDLAPIQRQMQGSAFLFGDFLYSVTTKFVIWSTEFCPLQLIGAQVDKAAASFGESMLASPLLSGIVTLAVVGLLLQGIRREPGWLGRLVVRMAVVAALIVMVAGAGNSRMDESGAFIPGQGSPGWFATTIDEAVTEIAASPAAALPVTLVDNSVGVDRDELSCGAYVNALRKGYEASTRTDDTLLEAKSIPAVTVSNLWQMSGYRAWSVGQFGRDNLNGQNRVACRMLDHNAGIPTIGSFTIEGQGAEDNRSTATRADVLSRVSSENIELNPEAPAWRPLNRVEQDKAWIAWAACVPKDDRIENLNSRDGWHTPRGQSWLIQEEEARNGADDGESAKLNVACRAFFNDKGNEVDGIFDWGDGDSKLKEEAGVMPASIYDFISSLHGTNLGSGGAAVFGYVLSALGVALVFGSVGVMILIVKAIAAFMLLTVVFVAILSLLPRADSGRLIRFAKIYIGLSLTAAFSVFILSLITLFTNLVLSLIMQFAGPNSDMMLILGGLAPVMAAVSLHFAFTKAGMPSPMTPRGAYAYSRALSGGSGLAAISAGGSQIASNARGMAGRGRPWFGGGRAPGGAGGRLGKRNAELNTNQPLLPKTAAEDGAAGPTPEDILNDPNTTRAQRDAVLRQRRSRGGGVVREPQEKGGAADGHQNGRPAEPPHGVSGGSTDGTRARQAKFGSTGSPSYRKTFHEAHPGIGDNVVVHHGVEQQSMRRYKNAEITPAEMHSVENLRGIPRDRSGNPQIDVSGLRRDWNRFYRSNPAPTRAKLLEQATRLDERYGTHLDPEVRNKNELFPS